VSERNVTLQEVTPDAEWENTLTKFTCSQITRVDLGGSYEAALLLVQGAS
jgi:hypothetical protein